MTTLAQRLRSAFVQEPPATAVAAPFLPQAFASAVGVAPLCVLFDARPMAGYLGCALALIAGQAASAPYALAITCCGEGSGSPRLRRPAGLVAARAGRNLSQAGFNTVASGRLVHLELGSELSSCDVADAVTVARSAVTAPTVVTVARIRDEVYESNSFAHADFCFAGLNRTASTALQELAASSISSIAPGGALVTTLSQRDALQISFGVVPQSLRNDVTCALEIPAL